MHVIEFPEVETLWQLPNSKIAGRKHHSLKKKSDENTMDHTEIPQKEQCVGSLTMAVSHFKKLMKLIFSNQCWGIFKLKTMRWKCSITQAMELQLFEY